MVITAVNMRERTIYLLRYLFRMHAVIEYAGMFVAGIVQTAPNSMIVQNIQ